MKVKSEILHVSQLPEATYSAMESLMQAHYRNVDSATFASDLSKKDWVILLKVGDELCGFSTQVLYEHLFAGKTYRILFSGDTIICPQHRNSLAFLMAGGKLMLDIFRQGREEPFYWLLTSKGYRTYRFMPLYFHEYFPRAEGGLSGLDKQVIEDFCLHYFGDAFDRKSWIIRAGEGSQSLNYEDGKITESRRKNPDVEFFALRNPGYLMGDELVCFASFSQQNIKPKLWEQLTKR